MVYKEILCDYLGHFLTCLPEQQDTNLVIQQNLTYSDGLGSEMNETF